MPYIGDLNPNGTLASPWASDEPGRLRNASRLLSLRHALEHDDGAPPPRRFDTLVLGTWNLREFDSNTWGERIPESYAYIAEIVDRFDLVAIQEVRAQLTALERLKGRLGPNWDYLVSDVTQGRAGNQERLAFLYDTRKVRFLGIAGELVLPPVETTTTVTTPQGNRKQTTTVPSEQVARTPLMAAFQVGWTRFVLATVHILYGPDAAAPR